MPEDPEPVRQHHRGLAGPRGASDDQEARSPFALQLSQRGYRPPLDGAAKNGCADMQTRPGRDRAKRQRARIVAPSGLA